VSGITVRLTLPRVIEWRGSGILTRADMRGALRATEQIFDQDPGPFDWLSDGTGIDSFEPGLPSVAVRWTLPRMQRIRRSAIVARQGPMLAVARTFQYLLPKIRVGAFTSREEALAFLLQSRG
jgi:hypothetical protein